MTYALKEGFTVLGKTNEDEMNYKEVYTTLGKKIAPKDSNWDYSCGTHNTNGISVGSLSANKPPDEALITNDANVKTVHHVTIKNCVVQNMVSGGISGKECDYVTFENCSYINKSWWEMWASSSFGFITTVDIDDNTEDYKLIMRNCISAGNGHFILWRRLLTLQKDLKHSVYNQQ